MLAVIFCDFQDPQELSNPVSQRVGGEEVTEISQEQEILYRRRLEEGYDLLDPNYKAWKVCTARHVVRSAHSHPIDYC